MVGFGITSWGEDCLLRGDDKRGSGDIGDRGDELAINKSEARDALAETGKWTIENIERTDKVIGFPILPRRWWPQTDCRHYGSHHKGIPSSSICPFIRVPVFRAASAS